MASNIENIMETLLNGRIKPRSCVKYPCGICYKSVKSNHKAVQCDTCDLWVHIGCNGTSDDEYELLKVSDDLWECLVCKLSNNLDRVPLTQCDNTELSHLNNTNSMRFLESLPSAKIVTASSKCSCSSSNDISIELPSKTSCKYYSVDEYQHHNKLGNLNIFHTNINGLGSKIDNL